MLFLAILLRLFGINIHSLWIDETTLLLVSGANSHSDITFYLTETGTSDRLQPLYFYMLYLWKWLLGGEDWVLRGLSVFSGILSVFVIARIAWVHFPRWHGVASVLFAALSSYSIYYSQEGRPYALAILLISILLFLFLNDLRSEKPKPIRILIFAVFSCLAIFTNVFSAIFLMSLAGADFLVRRQVKRFLLFWVPAGIASIALVLFWLLQLSNPTAVIPFPSSSKFFLNFLFAPYGLLVGQTFGPTVAALHEPDKWKLVAQYWPSLGILGLAVLGWLGVALLLVKQRRFWSASFNTRQVEQIIILTIILGFSFGATVGFFGGLNWLPRHIFYLFPLMIFIIPMTVRGAFEEVPIPTGVKSIAISIMLIILGANLSSTYNYYFDYAYRKDDYRGVAQLLLARTQTAMPVVMLAGDMGLLKHYGVTDVIDGTRLEEVALSSSLRRLTNGAPKLLILLNREFYWKGSSRLPQIVRRDYETINMKRLAYFSLYELNLKLIP